MGLFREKFRCEKTRIFVVYIAQIILGYYLHNAQFFLTSGDYVQLYPLLKHILLFIEPNFADSC